MKLRTFLRQLDPFWYALASVFVVPAVIGVIVWYSQETLVVTHKEIVGRSAILYNKPSNKAAHVEGTTYVKTQVGDKVRAFWR